MQPFLSTDILASIANDLANQGWSITPDFLPIDLVSTLAEESTILFDAGKLIEANIGKGHLVTKNTMIRGDHIGWIDNAQLTTAQQALINRLELLRQTLNANLQLGLFEYEGHFSVYPTGSFYRKHLDQFQNDTSRIVSCILYLNTTWEEKDGGELRIYLHPDEPLPYIDTLPIGGTLVTFLSSNFWHEVLPANKTRLSATGWFKTRSNAPA